jgi:hypothetical protein
LAFFPNFLGNSENVVREVIPSGIESFECHEVTPILRSTRRRRGWKFL